MPPRSTLAPGLIALTLALTTGLSADQNWPRFRGANAGAIANDPSLPDTWSATQNVAWMYFTGKQLDDETGLMFYGARYYSPILGRFITPDTVVQAPMNPQTLNRYSYCGNNPVNLVDHDGHKWSWGKFFSNVVSAVIGVVVGILSAGALTPVPAK